MVFAFAGIGILFTANFLLSNATNFFNVGNHNYSFVQHYESHTPHRSMMNSNTNFCH